MSWSIGDVLSLPSAILLPLVCFVIFISIFPNPFFRLSMSVSEFLQIFKLNPIWNISYIGQHFVEQLVEKEANPLRAVQNLYLEVDNVVKLG